MTWTEDELRHIGDAAELRLASSRPDGGLRPYVTMWAVRVGDEVYVRSAGGPDRPWYRHAIAAGAGRVSAGGVERDVTFADADPEAHPAIDAAYRAKYVRYGPEIVGHVTGPDAKAVTIRLTPVDIGSQP